MNSEPQTEKPCGQQRADRSPTTRGTNPVNPPICGGSESAGLLRSLYGAGWLAVLWAGLASAAAIGSNVVVSVYQGVCREGDFGANLATAREVVQQAVQRGSQFLAFPECFLSGYESREAVQRGARALNDPDLTKFIAESGEHDMVILAGLARREGTNLFNTVLVIHRGRLLGFYDKVMLTGGDRQTLGFSPGTAVPVFQAHGIRFAVAICADTSYPHVALAARLQGAQLLFTPHNNQIAEAAADDHRHWVRHCHIGLACQLQLAVARANIVKTGRPGQVSYGDSFILSPQGSPLAEAGLFKPGLITATLTPGHFRGPHVWGDLHDAPAWLRQQVADLLTEFRAPANDTDLRDWLENMLVFHRFSPAEVSAATGLTLAEVDAAARRLGLTGKTPPPHQPGQPLRVLPYPGGRHPRAGFFEGAVMPQRETKVSVFAPWTGGGYVVVDVPEAIFSNLGLIYLAHTHIPTVWDRQGIKLPRQEWQRHSDGHLSSERTLPNGIAFGTEVRPGPDGVRFALWLRNGTTNKLTGLRVQNCVMLAGAVGFAAQTLTNKVFAAPFAAARAQDGRRWVITAWERCGRVWGNELVPCLHSDPVLPDCLPGQTVRVGGWLSFFEGEDVQVEFRRLAQGAWGSH